MPVKLDNRHISVQALSLKAGSRQVLQMLHISVNFTFQSLVLNHLKTAYKNEMTARMIHRQTASLIRIRSMLGEQRTSTREIRSITGNQQNMMN